MFWGRKRPRSKPIYKTQILRAFPKYATVQQLDDGLRYIRMMRAFGHLPYRKRTIRTGYYVNRYGERYKRALVKQRLNRKWR